MRPVDTGARLEEMLETAGLDPGHLDAWEAWKVFNAFVREPVETDGDGVAVQAMRETTPEGLVQVHLEFYRQFTSIEEDVYEPTWFVGIKLVFDASDFPDSTDLELWSYDFATFQDFAAWVEQESVFVRAIELRGVESSVISGEI